MIKSKSIDVVSYYYIRVYVINRLAAIIYISYVTI